MNIALLEEIHLRVGAHDEREEGVCLLEAVAYIAGENHSDQPICVCPVLAAFGRAWNDDLDDETRQKLKPYIPRMIGTAGDGHAERRGWMAFDWLSRTCAPAWLELAGLPEHAAKLRGLPEPVDHQALAKAQIILDAALGAAWAAARGAAWAAAREAAARAAAGGAARAAASAAARGAASAAAWDSVRGAARAAAHKSLAPTVATLQASAFNLFDRMCALGEDTRRAA